MFGFGLPELIILTVILVIPVIWIIALVDAIKSNFTGYNKLVWILLIIFIPLLGSLLYLTIGRGQRIQSAKLSLSGICACGVPVAQDVAFCSACGSKRI
jgi:hypothetical protein